GRVAKGCASALLRINRITTLTSSDPRTRRGNEVGFAEGIALGGLHMEVVPIYPGGKPAHRADDIGFPRSIHTDAKCNGAMATREIDATSRVERVARPSCCRGFADPRSLGSHP